MKNRSTTPPKLASKIKTLKTRLTGVRAKSRPVAADTPAAQPASKEVRSKLTGLKTRLARLTARSRPKG